MIDSAEPPANRDLAIIFRAIAAGKYWFLVAIAAALTLAIIYLRGATYSYTIDLTVVPAQSSRSQPSGALAGVAQIAGISLGGGDQVAPLDLYIEQIYSQKVADRLASRDALMRQIFAGEWDMTARRWYEPKSGLRSTVNAVKATLGLPVKAWQPPDGARLRGYLQSTVHVVEFDSKPILKVSMEHPDPRFSEDLLLALHGATDDVLRQTALAKAGENISYLKSTLPTLQIAEQRAAFAAMLSEQEKIRMLGSSSSYYAAELLDGPNASPAPTSPKPLFVLLGAILAGAALALAGILLRLQVTRTAP